MMGYIKDSQSGEMQSEGIAGYPFWHWWATDGVPRRDNLVSTLYKSIKYYLMYCENRPMIMGYPAEAIRRHRALFEEYFKSPSII